MKTAFPSPVEQVLFSHAVKLRDSALFVTSDPTIALLEKQDIFLVVAGLKPVSEVDGNHEVWDEDGQLHILPDDEQEIAALFDSLQLKYHLAYDDTNVHATVSKQQALVDEYVCTSPRPNYGKLLGYPDSAVEAYESNSCMSFDEQDAIEIPLGIGTSFFRFSRNNWRQELEVELDWRAVLKHFGLANER